MLDGDTEDLQRYLNEALINDPLKLQRLQFQGGLDTTYYHNVLEAWAALKRNLQSLRVWVADREASESLLLAEFERRARQRRRLRAPGGC